MSERANQAICNIYHRTVFDIKAFAKNKRELDGLESSYFRYVDLARLDLQLRNRIMRRYGLLGVHFPTEFVSPKTAKQLTPVDISSGDVRKTVKVWEMLEEYLAAAGESTYAQFRSFLMYLNIEEPTSQAIDSAIRTHPEIFEERFEGREKLVRLRNMPA
jgi:hypothetical protein